MTTLQAPVSTALPAVPVPMLVRLAIIVVICVALSLISPAFATIDNALNLLRQASLLFLVASGLTLVIIGGGLDLSIGANLTLCACLSASVIKLTGQPVAGVAVALGCGTLVGLTNGLLINRLKIPAFLATFGMLWVAQGIAYWFMAGQVIYGFPAAFRFFGGGFWLGVPVPIWVMLAVGAGCLIFLTRTTIGREVYVMGANEAAASLSGIPIARRRMLLYALSGFAAGLAALIYVARLNAAEPGIGEPLLLPAIAAVLVGGTSLFGGSGSILGTLSGAVILTLIVAALNLLNVGSAWHPFVTGAVILLAMLTDAFAARRAGH
ncbi:ABC transporter permease [Bradyrhizobium tropiciagri]|uniref:ABC transporter permease n=1 Tax=Bradyrhizobium tropiciagri TaxID=312253 RepID=UPI001BAC792F|nr:ABC transporter permease [Bradyrhizobium tropiciagri]MBR0869446.1 ABC transporter permease [Bradyrhizobium tropiciagri]